MRLMTRYLVSVSLASMVAASATAGWASSHREAPSITEQPKIDGTDFYMFRSYEPGKEDFVTLIANYIPLQSPYGGPNYFVPDQDAIYEIHIDNDGDAIEDLTFRFQFRTRLANGGDGIAFDIGDQSVPIPLRQSGQITEPLDPDINEREFYSLFVTEGDRRSGERRRVTRRGDTARFVKPIDNIGNKTLPDYDDYADDHLYRVRVPGCRGNARVFVGQREEAFAVNLGEIFDLVNLVPIPADIFPGGIEQDRKNDDLVGLFNVTSLALELPISCLTGDGNGVIGGWTTSSLQRTRRLVRTPSYNNTAEFSGGFVQQSRLSAPLVNEVVIGLPDKDLFNSTEPMNDAPLAFYVTNPTLPALIDALFRDAVNSTLGTDIANLAPNNIPRQDLVAAFLTGFPGLNQQAMVTPSEMMRLNTAVPPTPRNKQSPLGVIDGDLAGFPNGRRPGDDVVDIELRVSMGRLCYPLPIGNALGAEENDVNLGLCTPDDAPVGNVPFIDGAPISAMELQNAFPYLNDPLPGSPQEAQTRRAP